MPVPLFQVDTFTEQLFKGNPAAVCLLDKPLSTTLMQNIAAENNLSETAFVHREGEKLQIRWFTPTTEVNLCGHATLAAAHVLLAQQPARNVVEFQSKSGVLFVRKENNLLLLDFPADAVLPFEGEIDARACLGESPLQMLESSRDLLCVFPDTATVRALQPNFTAIAQLKQYRGIIATAPGEAHDFVSRFFAPQVGVEEDPVTGSTHTSLIPYWAGQLGKKDLKAIQLSARGGELHCQQLGERVAIGGKARTYLEGRIWLA